MNKKLFLGMFAAATMLFATSCQNDELDAVQAGNEATVSFTLGVEGGVQTRATTISDGSGANKLVYAVFDEDGKRISTIAKVEKEFEFPGTEKITLAKGQTYKVAFWAQNSATSAYVLDDYMNLTIDYTSNDGKNNDETRDAFFKTVEFTVNSGNLNVDVVLKRPFAQINVGVYTGDENKNEKIDDTEKNEDWEYAVASGVTIAESKVIIKNAATTLNLVSGNVGGNTEVTYDFNNIPAQWLEVETDATKAGKEHFKYLSMSYFLVNTNKDDGEIVAGDTKSTLGGLEFTFRSGGKDIVLGAENGLTNVPVQRNWRTNIIGKLLTGDVEFKISIDPIYNGETNIENGIEVYGVRGGNKLYKTLKEALDAGETNILLGEGTYTLSSVANKSLTIGGIGAKSVLDCKQAIAMSGCDLTFENLTIESSTDGYVGFQHITEATYRNCTIKNTIFLYASSTFEGCTFNAAPNGYSVWTYASTKTIFTDCTFKNDKKAILVFHDCNPTTCELYITDCTFTATDQTTDKAAIEIHTEGDVNGTTDNGINGKLYIKNSTQTGFGGGLWRELNHGTKKETSNFEVYVDGQRVNNPVYIEGVKYGNIEAALAAVPVGGTATIKLGEGYYDLYSSNGKWSARGKNLTFVGTGDPAKTIIPCNNNNNQGALQGSTVTFESLTIETDKGNYLRGFQHVAGATFKECIIQNSLTLYNDGADVIEFENCTFHVSGNEYNFWSWHTSASFEGCTFNCDGKAALVYRENGKSDISFTECIFNDFGGQDGKAAIETGWDGSGYNPEYDIRISKCEVNGFDVNSVSGSKVWGNKNSMGVDRLNVVIDNVDVY